jgi:hypothetical protein
MPYYIVPQHSIRGVAVDMTRAAVVRRLGNPAKVVHGKNELGKYTEFTYGSLRITFAFDRNVSQVQTTSPHDRTKTGVGVGSTEAQLRAGVKGETCKTESGVRHCSIGQFAAGKIVTDFFLRAGKVWRVVVGRVLD